MLITKQDFNFSFDASKCQECQGACCKGESGNIWIKVQDIKPLANFLRLDSDTLLQNYIEKRGYRFSFKEVEYEKGQFACIFFDLDTNRCKIYQMRPLQCRTFPFWSEFKNDTAALKKECIGVVDG